MLQLVATRLANRRITNLFCARTRNASFLPANHPHRQPCPARVCTRKPPRCRAQHAPVPQRTPHAVSSTRPYPQTASMPCPARARTPMPCPARARTSTRTARRAQHAPASAHHALLRFTARQYARGFFPEALDLKSTWYDATATEILAASVNRTLTAYPRASPPRRLVAPLPLPPLPPRRLLRLGSALLHPPLSLFEYRSCFPRVFLLFLSGILFGCVVLFFYFI